MSNISRFIGNERGDKICHEDDGCPTEFAVLKRFWREQQASTLPEEVANLVELLDEEEVPYEDSLGVALSLTGRTKQYANGKTATLRKQVEKLTKERDDLRSRRCEVCGYLEHEREHTGCLREQLAALAEQNTKFRKVLLRLACLGNGDQYGNSIGNCIAQEALSLPDLASPVLNRIRAEGMREAEKIVRKRVQWVSNGQGIQYRSTAPESISAESLADEIRARADELEKTND